LYERISAATSRTFGRLPGFGDSGGTPGAPAGASTHETNVTAHIDGGMMANADQLKTAIEAHITDAMTRLGHQMGWG
ncbi:MAG TPA: hypothetical protein VF316_16600, partial [Polyangiaceae bacterium]